MTICRWNFRNAASCTFNRFTHCTSSLGRRRSLELRLFRTIVASDTGVDVLSDALQGKRILLAITGGIAAVESVRLARELRRHQASLTVMMTEEATKIITPLAVSWASEVDVLTSWSPEMAQLDNHDIVLVAPATRNTIAKFVHGINDSPVMMALSAARGRGSKICFVPSMHKDLFDDPVTGELLDNLLVNKCNVLFDDVKEGKRKQPEPVEIVAKVCHLVNHNEKSKKIAITLGANRAPIDAVRAIQNASSGRTGWMISEYLFRKGHEIICIAGKTSSSPTFKLPLVIRDGTPDGMLEVCKEVAKSHTPDVWIHAAAVLDYYTVAEDGKKASGSENWHLELSPGPKHISELADLVKGAYRIGFKLESGVNHETLEKRALEQIERYGVDAVVANIMEEMNNPNSIRARIIESNGEIRVIESEFELCSTISALIST